MFCAFIWMACFIQSFFPRISICQGRTLSCKSFRGGEVVRLILFCQQFLRLKNKTITIQWVKCKSAKHMISKLYSVKSKICMEGFDQFFLYMESVWLECTKNMVQFAFFESRLLFHRFYRNLWLTFCPDFRNESNGKFELGVSFFSSDKFRLFN